MDKKGKMTMRKFLTFIVFLSSVLTLSAQDVKEIQFSDKKYEYGIGKIVSRCSLKCWIVMGIDLQR